MPFKEKFKEFFEKLARMDDSPKKVAAGVAVGVFLGIFPGEGVTAAIIAAFVFRLNKLSTIAGALATNMWTTVIVLPISAWVGGFLFGTNPAELIRDFEQIYRTLGWKIFLTDEPWELALPLIVGFFIVAGFVSLVCYLITFNVLKNQKIKFAKK